MSNGTWLLQFSSIVLAVAGAAVWQWRQERRFRSEFEEATKCANRALSKSNDLEIVIKSLRQDHSSRIDSLDRMCRQLADQQATLRAIPDRDLSIRTAAASQPASFPSLNQMPVSTNFYPYQQPESTPFQSTSSEQPPSQLVPLPPTPAQQQEEITDAINRGDRNRIKPQIRAQLNLTSSSETAIYIGKAVDIQLEEVSGGGSYWLIFIGDEPCLYPTDQTLKGYLHYQPDKGIFNYLKEQVSAPQVLAPARLARNGQGWQVVAMGTIAVPG